MSSTVVPATAMPFFTSIRLAFRFHYTPFMWEKLARFVVELTTEYNRVYETEGRYPDVPITIFSQAFSEALFDNKEYVTATHIRRAIENTKAVYPDVIKKYLPLFDAEFKDLLDDDRRDHEGLADVDVDKSPVATSAPVMKHAPANTMHTNEQVNLVTESHKSTEQPVINNTVNKSDDKIDTIEELNDFYDNVMKFDNK